MTKQLTQHFKADTSKGPYWTPAFWRKCPEHAHSSNANSWTEGHVFSIVRPRNNLRDRPHWCYCTLQLVKIQWCQIFRSNVQTPDLSIFWQTSQRDFLRGGLSASEAWQWWLCWSVCDLPGDRRQVPGHLLLCYLWAASPTPGAEWGRGWSSEGWCLYKSQASWGRHRGRILRIKRILQPACVYICWSVFFLAGYKSS